MTLLEQIEKQLRVLPPEKQSEALNFIKSLAQQAGVSPLARKRSLKRHPAFGSWKDRNINAIEYQRKLRAEWEN